MVRVVATIQVAMMKDYTTAAIFLLTILIIILIVASVQYIEYVRTDRAWLDNLNRIQPLPQPRRRLKRPPYTRQKHRAANS